MNKQAAEIRNANFTSDNRFSPLFNLEENNIDSGDSFNARRCVFSETQDSKDDHVESHNRTNNKTKKLVVIAGDSIVQQVDENKMSRNKSNKVRCFPGAKVEDMAGYTKPLLKSQPTTIIVHAGTNNLKSEDAIAVRNKLLTLKDNIEQKHPNTAVILSTLTPRTDDRLLEQKVRDVNELLINSGVDIVNNDNV